ncbi:MAG: hypothetical protein LBD01_05170 [Puniceicoccales bacterium]|jgi:hypothetical protein|nr:hypothetical protein [Puniceicoccales bacterium]
MKLSHYIRKLYHLSFLLASSTIALAQAPSTSPAGAQLPVKIGFSPLSLTVDIEGLTYRSGGREQRLKIPSSYKPLPMRYEGLPKLLFYRQTSNKGGERAETQLVAEAVLPAQATGHFLILFMRDAKASAERYSTLVVPDVDFKTGKNSWRFINLGRQRTLLDMESKHVVLEPGQSTLVDWGEKELGMMIRCFLQEGQAWSRTQSFGSYFHYRPGRPKTYFIVDNPSMPKSLTLKGVMNAVEEKRTDPVRR